MDVGTAKPTPQQRAEIPHHLIDVADPWEPFSVARFVELADQAVADAHQRGRPVIAVGGTILYFKCFYQGLFEGPPADPQLRARIRQRARTDGLEVLHAELVRVDPAAADRIHRNDLRRIERALEVHQLTGTPISELQRQWSTAALRRSDWNWTLIGLRLSRETGNRRINERVRRMVAAGLVEEARRIWADPRGVSTQARQAVGYAELFAHFERQTSLEEAIERIKIHSRQLAKHQRSWLKRFDAIQWTDVDDHDVAALLPKVMRLGLAKRA
jgi:tRNA dimethylallyltransferase